MLIPVVIFGLPVLAAICIGPERTDRLAQWMAAQGHTHGHLAGREVPAFSLIDQQSQSVTREDLKGHVWIASFFFSRCAGTCPMTATKMANLQRNLNDPKVKLVSFSMDPEHDTPQVLNAYSKRFDADTSRWQMLTGARNQIAAVVSGLGLGCDPEQGSTEIIHSDRFVLIDPAGRSRAIYDSNDASAMERLMIDAERLASER